MSALTSTVFLFRTVHIMAEVKRVLATPGGFTFIDSPIISISEVDTCRKGHDDLTATKEVVTVLLPQMDIWRLWIFP